MQKSFWMPRDAGCVANSEMSYDNSSKMEPKRSHQWFMDGSAPEVFTNKRQAIETITGRPVPDVSTMNVPSWDNNNNFQSISGQFADRLFGSEPVRPTNLVDRNIASFNSGDMGRKYIGDQFVNDSSVNLSMSHASEDPSAFLNFGGLKKVKINQVREPNNSLHASMGSSYRRHVGAIPIDGHYSKTDGNTISLGPSYPNGDENKISMGSGYTKEDESFISMGHSFSKEDGNFISMGHNYDKGSENILSMGQPFPKRDGGFISMGQTYLKGDRDVISMTSSYSKDHSNFISMTHGFGKGTENPVSMNPAYSKDNDNMVSIGHSYDKDDPNIVHIGPTYEKGDSGILSVGHNYKGEGSAISFGVFNNETETSASGTIIGNYELVLDTEGSVQASEVPSQKEAVDSNADPIVNTTATSKANPRADSTPKKEPKMAKKLPPNNFPSNVKSLLSTGMLDGVPVKYVSWSREKNLKAIIKGTGYLCGCNNCNHSKSLNAYEFERHAGCKTKHPNNHIYFDNGKTIYAVVQELKNTPQEMLFDAIQTVTGSPINQKNFRIWKASYQAATRELQRIYGTDEVKMPC